MWDLRMVLLMLVAICLNATILLEQPYSSFFEFYPRFRELVAMLQKQGGPTAAPWPIPPPGPSCRQFVDSLEAVTSFSMTLLNLRVWRNWEGSCWLKSYHLINSLSKWLSCSSGDVYIWHEHWQNQELSSSYVWYNLDENTWLGF